jgi:hypothetical protein
VELIQTIKKHQRDILKISLLVLLYSLPLVLTITVGIPNPTHPFPYFMDEWHQFQAVKSVFKQLSNNVPGAAHGTMFQFILTGFYLLPFYFLHVINPFVLKSSMDALAMQEKIFVLLRLNSLLFGIGSLVVLYVLAKKYLRVNPFVTCLLFLATPIWMMLSGYFKYDIALTFWLLCALLALLHYRDKPTLKHLLISCGLCALTLATKISTLPVIPIYLIAFLLFTPQPQKHFKWLALGTAVFILVFCLVGIPDVLLQRGDWREFLYANLIAGPQTSQNIKIPGSEYGYLFLHQFPVLFGHGFFVLILFSLFCWIVGIQKLWGDTSKKITAKYKTEVFIMSAFLLFLLSILPLRLTAAGNRCLVLLPFFALLCSLTLETVKAKFTSIQWLINVTIIAIICLQLFESYAWLAIKLHPYPQQSASRWIVSHIHKGSQIGLENIPIYQEIPDVLLKDYYMKVYNPKTKSRYSYEIVDKSMKKLPEYICISRADYEQKYFKTSPKKDLLARMTKEHYKEIAVFSPNLKLYYLFNNELDYTLSGLMATDTINIYQQKDK